MLCKNKEVQDLLLQMAKLVNFDYAKRVHSHICHYNNPYSVNTEIAILKRNLNYIYNCFIMAENTLNNLGKESS